MSRKWYAGGAVGAAAIAAVVAATGAQAGSTAHPASASTTATAARGAVHAWVTGSKSASVKPAAAAPLSIRIDPSVQFQTVDGFGAALTDSSAHVLYRLSKPDRDQVMTKLFDPTSGAGIDFLRQPIGASDFVDGADYSFDDVPAGQTDYQLKHFTIAHDEAQILPLLRQARALNPNLHIVASPWSMPAWMKTNDSMIDGKLIDSPRIYRTYANYLVKFLQAYAKAGAPVDFITVQNEPQALERNNYPGTDLPYQQEAKVIDALGPAIKAAGLHTRILGFDHNWGEHWGDVKSHEAVNEDPQPNYPYNLLQTNAAKSLGGLAYHCYFGDPSAQTALRASFPKTDIYMTECEGGDISTALGVLNNWGKSVIDWNIALDENHGPHQGGCGTCNGTITVNSKTNAVTYNPQYFMLEHFAKFVQPGAARIASTDADTTGNPIAIQNTAFRNPDGSTALVVWNSSDSAAQTFNVLAGGLSFSSTLDPGAIATFTW